MTPPRLYMPLWQNDSLLFMNHSKKLNVMKQDYDIMMQDGFLPPESTSLSPKSEQMLYEEARAERARQLYEEAMNSADNKSYWSGESLGAGNGMTRWTYTPQAYLDAIEKYKNDPEALARINSGIRSFEARDTALDNFFSGLGIAHGTVDKMKMEYALNFDDYLKQTLNDLETRDYNSEIAKVKREKNAGINSDLQGIGGASEESNMQPDESMPQPGSIMQQQDQTFQQYIGGVANTCLSLVSGMMQLGRYSTELEGMKLSNQLAEKSIAGQQLQNDLAALGVESSQIGVASGEISLEDQATDYAIKTLAGSAPAILKPDFSDSDLRNVLNAAVSNSSGLDHLSSKAKSAVLRKLNQYKSDIDSGVESLAVAELKSRLKASLLANRNEVSYGVNAPEYSDDDITLIKNIGLLYGDYITDMTRLKFESQMKGLKANIAGSNADIKEQENRLQYQMLYDPKMAAYSMNAANRASWMDMQTQARTDKLFNDISEKLEKSKSKMAALGLAFLPAVRAWCAKPTFPGIPAFSISRHTNDFTGKSSRGHGDGVSFSFGGSRW